MENKLKDLILKAAGELYGQAIEPVLTRPDEQFGDYATNVSLQLAGKIDKNPKEIAEAIAAELTEQNIEATVAGPGFINIRIGDDVLFDHSGSLPDRTHEDKTVLLEYSCPNAFKELHTGHLYQTIIGDAMARVYENAGAKVFRVSFGGDVGLHVAKCMWGILEALGGENYNKLSVVTDHAKWIAEAYVCGSKAYEENEQAKTRIEQLNKKIYELHANSDKTSSFAQIYFTCRQWSYDYFEAFYDQIGVQQFDKYYPESETIQPGLELVRQHLGPVFTSSDGAVILDESRSKLHTRVFITKAGLPTYETKDLGVILLESNEFPYDKRILMTGNEQLEYMKVIFAAMSLIDPELGAKQEHRPNGTVRFGDGSKMSSRLGNVSRAMEVVEVVEKAVQAPNESLRRDIALGAIKYSFLKNRVGGDIAFDLEQSISMEGNSGPYLQYALVRARSILAKLDKATQPVSVKELDQYERSLARKLSMYLVCTLKLLKRRCRTIRRTILQIIYMSLPKSLIDSMKAAM
jgi:arginyl-tRNA synthetase